MKLKQKLALGLCAFYMMSEIGLALSMHFCGGKLASVAFYTSKNECKFCKAEAPDKADDGCCKNTKLEVKVKDSHQTTASYKLPKLVDFEYVTPFLSVTLFQSNFLDKVSSFRPKESIRPPAIALHLLNCVFRN